MLGSKPIPYRSILIIPAWDAGMKIPKDVEDFDPKEYPHFALFCKIQIDKEMKIEREHWYNAIAIAKIPEKKLKKITKKELRKRGVSL